MDLNRLLDLEFLIDEFQEEFKENNYLRDFISWFIDRGGKPLVWKQGMSFEEFEMAALRWVLKLEILEHHGMKKNVCFMTMTNKSSEPSSWTMKEVLDNNPLILQREPTKNTYYKHSQLFDNLYHININDLYEYWKDNCSKKAILCENK